YTGRTYVNDGTLQLNKSGTAQAIVSTVATPGALIVGDTRGPDNADQVTYGPNVGTAPTATQATDQIINTATVTVLSTGKFDLSAAATYTSAVRLLTVPTNTADGTTITL